MASLKITQSNGAQGLATFGRSGPSKDRVFGTSLQMESREVRIQLDGDEVAEVLTVDFSDDTRYSFPDGSLIESAKVFSQTGVAALNVGSIDDQAAGSVTNILAAVSVNGNDWYVERDIDLATAAPSQLVFSGMAAGETCEVIINTLQPVASGTENGVLGNW